MALTRLTNLISSRNGRMIYVSPDDFNATDLISNNGSSPTRPFKTIQRAALEVARFSYVAGKNNDKYDQFTISLAPGDYVVDNRPGKATAAEVPELTDQSNFDILDPANDLYKFNSTTGGFVVPRGTSVVGMDLRKTRVRPRYVPRPTEEAGLAKTSIFKVTGACYFWQFSLFDALPLADASGLGGVYQYPDATTTVNADYSHHKVTCFVYADQTDLNLFYQKAAKAFASIPDNLDELASRTQENRIVGPLQQSGQKPISSININGSIITITTTGVHEIFEGQQITLAGIIAPYSNLNGTYYVSRVNTTTQFTIAVSGFAPGNVGSLTNAIVKAEIDTVDSSSPYIFNCSLRSTYGLCGLWADGDKVTGFKSMVVAQFTGVSLQKDDRAFVKFTELTSPYPSFVQEGGSTDAVALHQESSGYVFYKQNWRSTHIRVSNDAFIQSVSVFAVGYAEQHLIENGGDYSITNSNSNFGTQALTADGFRPDAFELDKKGYITHIVPPQTLDTIETQVPYYPIDVFKSRVNVTADGVGSKIHLYEQTDPNKTPAFDINQYKIGGRISDKLYVNLVEPVSGAIQECFASIDPNGNEQHIITTVDVGTNLFTTNDTNTFETATPIRIYSSTGYLPLGMEPNKLYYAIKNTNTSFKIAPSADDARAGAGGAVNSIVNIRSIIPAGATLTVNAYVSDTVPDLPNFDISVNANQDNFSTGTYSHGFSTGDKVFFKRRIIAGITSSGVLPLLQREGSVQSISLTTEYYVTVIDSYNFKIADSESNANNVIIIPIDTNGDVNTIKVYRNIQKSPLKYDPVLSNWYISVRADITNTIHPILKSSNTNSIYSNISVSNTENTSIRRIADDRSNADRTYRLRYVIPKTELNSRPPLVGYVIRRKSDANNVTIPYNTLSQSGQTAEFTRIYFIYKINTILDHIPGEQDGVYYLTVLLADIAPNGSQFNSNTNDFAFLKYSQDVAKIYPDLDKDNPISDTPVSISVADNLVHGYVYQNNDRNSITKEALTTFATDTGFAPTLNSIGGKAVSGQENRLISFSSNNSVIQVELRRTSQIRAGNQTFEYTGFGSGNYSTGFPSKQQKVLTDKEVLYSQAQRRRAGVVFYSGLNAYGDLYVGNQKINAVTGEVEILDKPILKIAGSQVAATQTDEYVPYISGTKNVNISGTLVTGGGANKSSNTFNNESYFNEGIKVSTKDAVTVNRALTTQDVIYRPKVISLESNFSNGNVKQTVLSINNITPTPGVEGQYRGDLYYKGTINSSTRHESYIYTGQSINAGWAQAGLVGIGHLTSIEEIYTTVGGQTTPEPYQVTGKFGINQVTPSGALHVGDGNVIFDSNLTINADAAVSGDLAVNGCDITSTCASFNLLNQPTTINTFSAGTAINLGAISGIFTIKNPTVVGTQTTVNLWNTTSTTVNAFGAATSIVIGASTPSGLTRIRTSAQIDGNLTVNGITTTVNSAVTTIKDPVITLGGDTDNANLVSNDSKDRGLELKYYDGSSKLGFIGWNNASSKYKFLKDATNTNEVFTGTNAEIEVGKITTTDTTNAFNYSVNPFATFSNGTYAASGNTVNTNTNFISLIEKYSSPVGVVVMWAGSIIAIPNGWALCNGGTVRDRNGNQITLPDLRNKFIVGAGDSYAIGSIGGGNTQTITTGNNSVTPTVSSVLTGGISGTALNRSQIPQHRHAIDHYHGIADPGHTHVLSDPGHAHGYLASNDGNTSHGQHGGHTSGNLGVYGATTNGASTGITIDGASTGIDRTKSLIETNIDPQVRYSGYGGSRSSPDGLDSLGPSSGGSDYGDEHTHAYNFSVSTTLSNTTHTHSFTIDTRPPYYALAFIFKL